MKTYIREIKKIKEEFEMFGIDSIILAFSKSVKESKRNIFGDRTQTIYDKNPIKVKFNLDIFDLIIEACENQADPEQFEDKINKYFNLKPHEMLLVNRRVYKKNTIAFMCEESKCNECLNFMICERNSLGKIFIVLELQSTYTRLRVRDVLDEVQQHTFGDNINNIFKRKQNELMEILASKLFFFANKDNLKFGGR